MTDDPKHQVLYALYSEYQKDVPEMEGVDCISVGRDVLTFNAAILKLQNEGYITGFVWHPPDTRDARRIISASRRNVYLTEKGVAYVEQLADIERSASAKQKIRALAAKAGTFGMEVLKEFLLSQLR